MAEISQEQFASKTKQRIGRFAGWGTRILFLLARNGELGAECYELSVVSCVRYTLEIWNAKLAS